MTTPFDSPTWPPAWVLVAAMLVGCVYKVACADAKPAAPEAPLEFAADLAPGECRVAVAPPGAGENLFLCRTDPNPGVRCYWTPRQPNSAPALSCVAVKP